MKNVYCLVRPGAGNQDAKLRVISNLKTRKLLHSDPHPDQEGQPVPNKPTTDETGYLARIIAYPSNLTHAQLGLQVAQYNALRTQLTVVIHCAWTMNYDMQLTSFEHLISDSSNLITRCVNSTLKTPTLFNFTSSISAAPALPDESIQEALNTNSMTLIGTSGYAQSKYVVEQLCANTAGKIFSRIHGLGYLVGDRTNEIWHRDEEYPLILRSLEKIMLLPSRPLERVSWLPVDDAAEACIQLMFLDADKFDSPAVFNVAHPQVISWDDRVLAGVATADHEFKTCRSRGWAAALRAKDPAYKLLGYLESVYGNNNDVSSVIRTVEAERWSKHLRECPAVTVESVKKFVQGWNITVVAS